MNFYTIFFSFWVCVIILKCFSKVPNWHSPEMKSLAPSDYIPSQLNSLGLDKYISSFVFRKRKYTQSLVVTKQVKKVFHLYILFLNKGRYPYFFLWFSLWFWLFNISNYLLRWKTNGLKFVLKSVYSVISTRHSIHNWNHCWRKYITYKDKEVSTPRLFLIQNLRNWSYLAS